MSEVRASVVVKFDKFISFVVFPLLFILFWMSEEELSIS